MGKVFCPARMEGKWSLLKSFLLCTVHRCFFINSFLLLIARPCLVLWGVPNHSSAKWGSILPPCSPLSWDLQWFGCPTFSPLHSYLVLALMLLCHYSDQCLGHPWTTSAALVSFLLCSEGSSAPVPGWSPLSSARPSWCVTEARERVEVAGMWMSLCAHQGWGCVCLYFFVGFYFAFWFLFVYIILMLTFVLQLHSLVKRSFLPGTAQGRHWS